MQRQRAFVWAAIVLCIVALLFQFLAVCLPHWEQHKSSTTRKTMVRGLFNTCEMLDDDDDDKEGTICWMHRTIPAWLDVVRTFEMFGLILLFITAILLTLYLLLIQWKIEVHTIFIATLFVIVFFLLIGISVYGHNADGDLHVAYAFAVIATILTIVPPVLLIVMCCCRRKDNIWIDQDREMCDRDYLTPTEMQASASRRSSKVGPMSDLQEQRAASRISQQAADDQKKEPLP